MGYPTRAEHLPTQQQIRQWPPPSPDPLFPGKEPGWPEEEDHDDEEKAHGVAVARGDVARAELLDQREDEAAEGRAREAAEPAEDHDRERLGRGEVAHARIRDEHRSEQRPARGG